MRRFIPLAVSVVALALAACSDPVTPVDPRASADVNLAMSAAPTTDFDLTLDNVELRPGVSADLHVRVFVDEDHHGSCEADKTVLALHGFAHTAATWEPFAEELFAERSHVCRLVALDLPGHGQSGLPDGGVLFGYLTLDDYVSALLGALERLPAHGIEVGSIIAHSQGGMVTQMAQQRLVHQNRSLRDAFGIHEVVLLAPTPPDGLPWAFVENGTAAALLSAFLVPADPVLGPHFSIPDPFWPVVFFSNLSGEVASGAPSAADVAARGFNAPEPLLSALELVGADPFGHRPVIDAGIFSGRHGTKLSIVSFENDQLVSPAEAAAILAHLTDKENGNKLDVIGGAEAVHDLYISDPAALLRGTKIR